MTLRHLHDAIQASMGWEDAHLHDFEVAGERFGDPATTDEVTNEARRRSTKSAGQASSASNTPMTSATIGST